MTTGHVFELFSLDDYAYNDDDDDYDDDDYDDTDLSDRGCSWRIEATGTDDAPMADKKGEI